MSHLLMILATLLVFNISIQVNAATMVHTDNGHSFSVEFEGDRKTVTYIPHRYGPLSSNQEMTKREDLLFLQYGVRAFCAPYHDGRDYKKLCIRAYNSLIQFAREGLRLSQLDGIYIAPSETIAENQKGFDPYTDIFGYSWVNGQEPLVAKTISQLIKKRATYLEKVREEQFQVSSRFRKDLRIDCFVKRDDCLQTLQIIRDLDTKIYQKINSRSWVTSIVIIGKAERLVSLELDGDFSSRSLTVSSESNLRQMSEQIDKLLL